MSDCREYATEAEVDAAKRICEQFDGVEVDDISKVSEADDGVWVAAWVWVPNERISE